VAELHRIPPRKSDGGSFFGDSHKLHHYLLLFRLTGVTWWGKEKLPIGVGACVCALYDAIFRPRVAEKALGTSQTTGGLSTPGQALLIY
jgi:hypothetical protein